MILTILLATLVISMMIFFNGLYVAGEFSSVSARKTRIIQMAEEGNRLAQTLLPVLQDPHKLDNYIAASQVGITLSSIVLGIYGEQQIAPLIAPWIAKLPIGAIRHRRSRGRRRHRLYPGAHRADDAPGGDGRAGAQVGGHPVPGEAGTAHRPAHEVVSRLYSKTSHRPAKRQRRADP